MLAAIGEAEGHAQRTTNVASMYALHPKADIPAQKEKGTGIPGGKRE
jgi:hypothetical protein